MIRFDAYSATTAVASAPDLLTILCASAPQGMQLKQGRGFHRFGERVSVLHDGHELGAVSWGGQQGDLVMFEVKGESTPAAVEALRAAIPHRCTRLDTCADFDAPAAFDGLLQACLKVKKDFKLKGSKAGDWDDFPEDGRTLYLGAPTSAVRVRLYEKGKQPEYLHLARPDWCRIEAQVRPKNDARNWFAKPEVTAEAAWGASPFTRALAADVLKAYIDPHPAGTTYRVSQRDKALQWMCKQYGSHLLDLLAETGSWQAAGNTLADWIADGRSRGNVTQH